MITTDSLDFNNERFEELLAKTSQLILDKFSSIEDAPAYGNFSAEEVRSWFDEKIPHNGQDVDLTLKETKEKVLDSATMNLGPYMYAYVMAGGTQVSILADMLASTVNQNVGKWHLAPAMSEIEKRIVQWGADFIGFGQNVGGVLVSGGSAANLTGLTVARNVLFEKEQIREKGLFGMKPFRVYASKEVHGCIDKSVESLGIGRDNLVKIDVHDDFTIDVDALKSQIDTDIKNGFLPFCIIGSAGTVNTGAIDPLNKLADLANQYNLWFHVDGAYGALAASLDSIRKEYAGIDRAHSVAMDFHKWLYQPFEAGCTLVKDWDLLRKTFFKQAAYLDTSLEQAGRLDFNEHQFQLSRSAKGLKIWMSFKTYGAKRFKEMIQKDIDLTHYLSDQMQDSDDFEVMSRSHLAVTCFKYKGHLTDEDEIEQLNKRLIPALEEDGRVFMTGTTLNGRFMLRACLINHRMQKRHIDRLLKVIRENGQKILEAEFAVNQNQ